MVRIHPDPPTDTRPGQNAGAIAQLGERLLCKQEVVGSIPSGSTSRDLENSSEEMKFVSVRTMDSRELKARGNCGGA